MAAFAYHGRELYCEEVPIAAIAQEVGTPCYIYSRRMLVEGYRALDQAFAGLPHLICYAMKANANLAILHFARRVRTVVLLPPTQQRGSCAVASRLAMWPIRTVRCQRELRARRASVTVGGARLVGGWLLPRRRSGRRCRLAGGWFLPWCRLVGRRLGARPRYRGHEKGEGA